MLDLNTQEVASVSDIDDVYGDQNDDDDASSKGDDVIDLNGGKYGRAMHKQRLNEITYFHILNN